PPAARTASSRSACRRLGTAERSGASAPPRRRRWSRDARHGGGAGTTPAPCFDRRRVAVGRDATLLIGLTLLVASCGCPDFRSNSLGVCTHILAILLQLAARPRVFRTALASGLPEPSAPRLGWDPSKPLYGDGDWLARIRLELPEGGRRREPA